jgi:hypothetical protein
MSIQDKIASWPPKAGPFFKPHSIWLQKKLRRIEAERDLALEVLRYAVDNPEFDSAKFDADARAVLAACGGESRE